MEFSKGFMGVITFVSLAVTSCVLFLYFSQRNPYNPTVDVRMPNHSMEFLDRYHSKEKKTTAIIGAGAGKCYILTNDENPGVRGRAMRIVPEQFSVEMLKAIGGQDIVEFCAGTTAVPVELVNEEEIVSRRQKRQQPTPGRSGGLRDFDAAKVAQTEARLSQNQCQNEMLVDCGEGGVYECVTGPGEVYRARTKCESATRFSFELQNRCKEFPKTEKFRFIKCLQAFILGTHLE